MRGPNEQSQHMFSYLSPEQRVPRCHPLRAAKRTCRTEEYKEMHQLPTGSPEMSRRAPLKWRHAVATRMMPGEFVEARRRAQEW